jgi:hypothetical protein
VLFLSESPRFFRTVFEAVHGLYMVLASLVRNWTLRCMSSMHARCF